MLIAGPTMVNLGPAGDEGLCARENVGRPVEPHRGHLLMLKLSGVGTELGVLQNLPLVGHSRDHCGGSEQVRWLCSESRG